MVNWSDPALIAKQGSAFDKILLFVLGLYVWEFVVTFREFEGQFLRKGRKPTVKWHHGCYLLCRYAFLLAMITLNITRNSTISFQCQSIYVFNQLAGNAAIGAASLNLLFRALAIWRNAIWISSVLGVIALGHWAILFYCSTSLSAHWDTTLEVCVLVGVDRPWILALYTYTMILDFFILCACIAGLARTRPSSEHKSLGSWVAGLARFSGQDGLWNLLYSDGVMYFLIAFVANLVPVIFLALSLNPVMDIITTIPAACVTIIASSRAVMRLNAWGQSNPPTGDDGYAMSAPSRPYRGPKGNGADGSKTSKKRWQQNGRYYGSNHDTNLPSAIFAKTVLLEDEPEVGDGTQYNRRSRAQSGSVGITLPHDDRSNTSSPTTPTPWSKESKPPASMVSVTTRSSQDQHYRSSSRRRSQSQERPAPPVSRGPTHRTHQSLGGRQDFSDPTMNNIPTEKDLNYVESGGVQDHQDGRGRWKG